jgi:serine/threonine protein kinase
MNTKQEFILIDLGVARHLDKTTLTSYGFTLGTIGYLSSEQMKAQRNLTCKSDMFSLGIVLLEAGLGHHPTNYNQKEILNIRDLVEDEYVRGWQFATLLEKILAIKAYERPHPEEVIQCIEQRGGK